MWLRYNCFPLAKLKITVVLVFGTQYCNPVVHQCWVPDWIAKFCKVKPNIFNLLIYSDFPCIQKNVYYFKFTRQMAGWLSGHSRIVGPHMVLACHQEFWGNLCTSVLTFCCPLRMLLIFFFNMFTVIYLLPPTYECIATLWVCVGWEFCVCTTDGRSYIYLNPHLSYLSGESEFGNEEVPMVMESFVKQM